MVVKNSFIQGKEGEEKVLKLLEKCGGGGIIAVGKFYDYDIANMFGRSICAYTNSPRNHLECCCSCICCSISTRT